MLLAVLNTSSFFGSKHYSRRLVSLAIEMITWAPLVFILIPKNTVLESVIPKALNTHLILRHRSSGLPARYSTSQNLDSPKFSKKSIACI